MEALSEFVEFLNRLESSHIYFRLAKVRPDGVMVEVHVPGERWEIEFLEDRVDVEIFRSDGTMLGEQVLERLFSEFTD